MTWRAPVRELLYGLTDVEHIDRSFAADAFPGLDGETISAVLDAGGRFAEQVIAPLNRGGDQTGPTFQDGAVRAASGFKAAYRQFADGGWNGLSASPAFGGQGLPKALAIAVFEMVHGACMAFGLCPMLTQGAIEVLSMHGTDDQKRTYLPKLIAGMWTGTMNLTEPQAGSDLAAIRTRAEPDGAGKFRLSGQKIFITWGDHDMTDNVVHLVLARLAGAPEGSRGISLFVAPKCLLNPDGAVGAANALRPIRIEHKLGIHGSPTCTMLFDGAVAEIVGAPNHGLAQMFTMMNAARLQVGAQGVGIAERAYQQALAYALDRRQGRSIWTDEYPARLYDLPDVRRMLLLMKAKIEAARAICLHTAVSSDCAKSAEQESDRHRALLREELFTPIAKAWSTDRAIDVTSLAVQVHGGMGYIEETGVAQHYRDARIAPIYEGTNGIQANDLVGRKLSIGNGEAAKRFFADVAETVKVLHSQEQRAVSEILQEALGACRTGTEWLLQKRGTADALAGAAAYLEAMGNLAGGWLLAKGAIAARQRAETTGDTAWLRGRTMLSRFFSTHVLSKTPALVAGLMTGNEDLARIEEEAL